MRRFVLCAALDAHQLSSDRFLGYCRSRASELIALAPRGEDLQIDIFEFRSGKIHTRKVTWSGGKASETIISVLRFTPITRDDFEERALSNNDVDKHAFKAGRPNVMSIRDVYNAICEIGKDTPNTLEEFSIFSHAYDEGPIMVNSYNDRRVLVPPRLRASPNADQYQNLQGTERNPDDKDCRAQYDFVAPTLPSARRDLFRGAFSKRGVIWVWGCNFDYKTNSLLSVVHRAIDLNTDLSDDTILKFKNLTQEQQIAFIEFDDILKLDRDRFLRTRSCELKFGSIRLALWGKVMSSYIYQAAQAIQVPCIGAVYGTYASFDQGRPSLMSISSDTARNVIFYKKHFGVKTDPEGRNYCIFTHGMKVRS